MPSTVHDSSVADDPRWAFGVQAEARSVFSLTKHSELVDSGRHS
ncbi:hypothetical protein [Modestobacter excelsi]|nr:hypothetical protein [Modestobacter excelsi]